MGDINTEVHKAFEVKKMDESYAIQESFEG